MEHNHLRGKGRKHFLFQNVPRWSNKGAGKENQNSER
jgi:hypothetical protein